MDEALFHVSTSVLDHIERSPAATGRGRVERRRRVGEHSAGAPARVGLPYVLIPDRDGFFPVPKSEEERERFWAAIDSEVDRRRSGTSSTRNLGGALRESGRQCRDCRSGRACRTGKIRPTFGECGLQG